MPLSRRHEIVNYFIDKLKTLSPTSGIIVTEAGEELITENGLFSLFTEQRRDNKEIYDNVFRGLKFIDQVNDFPSIYVQAGQETFNYNSKGVTTASLPLVLRLYTYEENAVQSVEELADSIVNIIERIIHFPEYRIIESTVTSVDSDNGLLDPYGLAEILLNVIYDVED